MLILSSISSLKAQEICDNGRDDDGDGLIDCFDEECSGMMGCEAFFYGQPVPDCGYTPPPLDEIEVTLLFETDEVSYPIDQRAGVFIGDMNGDGIADLVSRDNNPPRIQIFSGDDGRILQSIATPSTHPFGQTAIADVDADGLGDVFQIEETGRLARYEFGNPDAVWRTNDNIGDDNNVSTPQLADINQDGRPEVYVGDRIFDAITGIRIVDGGNNVNVGGYAGGNNSDRFPIYFDLFSDGDPRPDGMGNFGPEANGLEYIAGNQVWTVSFTANTLNSGSYQLAAELDASNNEGDGLTSIADINGDGQMDIAVMDGGKVYAWDPYTNQQIGATFDVPNTSSGGRINIGDFDGDGDVELGFAGRNIYIVRDYKDTNGNANLNDGTWSDLWRKTGLDDGSERTGSTLFDFDGDGRVEVVYSEEEDLFIYDGATGVELFQITSRSGTRTEYPLIADVNGDGTAEIVVTAQERNGPQFSGDGWISVYTSANQPWVPARAVWNQHGYNVMNVNDDLTIPQFQQDPLIPALGDRYNNFLVQTSIGGETPVYPAPDAIIDVVMVNDLPDVDFSDCPNTITINLRVDNGGSAPLPATTPISFYDGDPRSASPNLIATTTLGVLLQAGGTTTTMVTVNVASVPAGSPVFLSVNDPGFVMADLPFSDDDFPLTGTAECNYSNNVSMVGNVRCGEVCGNGKDDDGDGLTDEPNLMQFEDTGCPGAVLSAISADVPGGTWTVVGGSAIGTAVNSDGVVTLGNNFTGSPITETIRYDDGVCVAEVTVTTLDDVSPEISCPGNITVEVGENCMASPEDYTGLAQVSDNCTAAANISVTQSPTAVGSLNLGSNTIMLTATDESGNSAPCTFRVMAVDRINPVITNCPTDQEVALNANCQFVVPDLTSALSVTDNCTDADQLTLAQTPVQGTVRSNDGTTVLITLTATDAAGNAANCTYTLTLNDGIPPSISCPSDQVRQLSDNDCTLATPDFRGQASLQDNCSAGNQITVTQSPAPGTSIVAPGTSILTLTATDENGNTSNCSFTLTSQDVTRPELTCPGEITVDADPSACEGTVTDVTDLITAMDNCDADNTLTISQLPVAGTTFSASTQNVTVFAEDAAGNISQCNVSFRKRDVTPPTVICPGDQQLTVNENCLAILPNFMSGAGMDACGGVSIVQEPGPGTNLSNDVTVTITVTDNAGLVSSCDFLVEVIDEIPPVINCPEDQTISVDGNCSVPLPDYTNQASAQDNCDPRKGPISITQTPAAGTMYSGDGTTISVMLTATDASGNVKDCSFAVGLEDMTEPSLSCPVSPQVEILDENCQAIIPDFRDQASATSMCMMEDLTLTQTPLPGTVVTGAQTIEISITAADPNGNSVSCSFDFQTIDVSDPVLVCPENLTENVDGDCEFSLPDYRSLASVSDNCSAPAPAPNILSLDQSSEVSVAGHGTVTTVMFRATDAAGNSSSCSFTVTLVDATPPSLSCPANQTEAVDGDCSFRLPDYTAQATTMDNCSSTNTTSVVQQPGPGTEVSGDGTIISITLTATDAAGNAASCSFDLLLEDTSPPAISCPPSQTLALDAACNASVPDLTNDATTSDNCSLPTGISVVQDLAAGSTLSEDGTTRIVTLTATDEAGNMATCTVSLQLDDQVPPTVFCPTNQDLNLDETGCSLSLPDLRSQLTLSDNCTDPLDLEVQQMPAAGTVLSGANTVEVIVFTVDDGNGNTANCSVEVSLRDVTNPVINCPSPSPLALGADCKLSLPDYTAAATVSDDCAMTTGLTVSQSPAPGTALSFDGEQIMVTLIADDGNGNTSSCTFPVIAEDMDAPSISCPESRDEQVSASCDFTLPDYTSEATVMDNCSEDAGITISQSPAPGTRLPEDQLDQPQTITLTATDQAGNAESCTFIITPIDGSAPEIICPEPQVIQLDVLNCEAILGDLTSLATVTDNCASGSGITLSQDVPVGTTYSGLTPPEITVNLTAEDESGNTASCSVIVRIRDENPPTVNCPPTQIIALDQDCNAEIPDLIPLLMTDDNCSATALTILQDPAQGASYSGHNTSVTVTFTVTDASGNSASCSSEVIFEDQSPPNPVICPGDKELNVDDSCEGMLPDYTDGATVLDNCRAQEDIIITQVPAPGTPVSGAGNIIMITLTADDGNGNTATCNFDVTLVDRDAPELTCPGGQIVIASDDDCDGVLEDYTDLVGVINRCMLPADDEVNYTQSPVAGTVLERGNLDIPQVVEITATDANGNDATCSFLVTLVDTLAPVITCPEDKTARFDASCGYAVRDYRSEATIMDNCADGSALIITQDPAPGSSLSGPEARQTITITAEDPSGNTAQCSFELVVTDATPPNLMCPEPDTLLLDNDCVAVIGDYRNQTNANDNCTDRTDLTISQDPAPGTPINGHLMTTTVTITAVDGSGNEAACDFMVTARDASQPTIACPGDQVIRPDANCDALLPDYRSGATVNDNCTSPTAIIVTQRPSPGTLLEDQGTRQTVTLIANDGNGNLDSCTFVVRLEDNQPPAISCPPDKTVTLDENCEYQLEDLRTQASALDNCTEMADILITQSIGVGETFTGEGTEIAVTLTADDGNDNTAQCVTRITLDDVSPPTIVCPDAQEISLDTDCTALVPDYRADALVADNCRPEMAINVQQVLAPGVSLSGHNRLEEITLTADDGNGNSASCSFSLQLKDRTPPSVSCPTDQEILVDGNCTTTLPDYTPLATLADNCTPAPALAQNNPAGTAITSLGVETVTLTADDGNGNISDCSFTVAIADKTPPELICPSFSIVPADENCTVTLADYRDSIMVSDNCGPLSQQMGALTLVQSPVPGASFSSLNAEEEVTITATDPSGNKTTCLVTVALADTTRPTIICPNDTTLVVDEFCSVSLPDYTSLATSMDNCQQEAELVITQRPLPGSLVEDEASLITVSLTATDASGNAVSCDFSVQLIDTLAPAIVCPADDLIGVDGDCEVFLPDYTTSAQVGDNCSDPTAITLTQSPAPGTPLSGDGTMVEVTLIATDESGNQDSCKLNVVLEDSTDPIITCPANQELLADDDCAVPIPDYTQSTPASSTCDQSSIDVTQEPAPGTIISGHNTSRTITLRAEDSSGNFITCSFTVTLVDRESPEIIACPTDTTGGLTADCTFLVPDYWAGTAATAIDNCRPPGTASTSAAGDQISYRQTPLPGTVLSGAFAEQTIVLTADDGNGNSVSCDFVLSLVDTIAPTIVCPRDTVANPDASCAFALEDYTSRAVVDDNCTAEGNLEITQSPPPGTLLSGHGASQEITLTVTDASGNTANCSFLLSLQDTISPSIICPNDQVEELSASCTFLVPDYTDGAIRADNCTEEGSITLRQSPAPGTLLSSQNEGDNFEVTLTADDGNGNTADCSFTVTLDDTTDPVLVCPADSTVYVDANCVVPLPDLVAVASATDNCGVPTITQQPLSGISFSGDGSQVPVTLVADDGNGNSSQCVVTVTLRDTISPTIICPADEVLFTDADCSARLPDYRAQVMVDDNCSSSGEITVSQSPAPGMLLAGDGASLLVTLTADDGNGNTANCILEVSIADNTSPTIQCPPTQIQFADGACNAVVDDFINLATLMDNCTAPGSITVTQLPAAGTSLNTVQTQLVMLTADDGNGNAASCEFLLSLTDNSEPTVTCPPSQVIDFGDGCTFSLPDYRTLAQPDDNCSSGALTLTQSPAEGALINGLNTTVEVSITVRDESGNEGNCRFTVTTTSPTPPPAVDTVALAVIEPPTGSGSVSLLDAFDPQAASNLSGVDLDQDQDEGIAPYTVGFFATEEAAISGGGGLPADYTPTTAEDTVVVRIEDPATGCFTISRIVFDLRVPGTSAAPDLVHCNRRPFLLEIDGQPSPGGDGTTIARHEWRLIDAGTTRLRAENLVNADQQVVNVDTEPLRSGTFVLEYQFFEDYGNGPLVPSVPIRIAVEVLNVGGGDFLWDGN